MPSKLGWMEPIYYDVGEDGRPVAVFSQEDFERIRSGYGCPNCWQSFDTLLPKCPVCQQDLLYRPLDENLVDMPEHFKPKEDDPDYKLKDRRHG